MAITFSCVCGQALQVGDAYAGEDATCPGCGKTLRIPATGGEYTEQAPPPAKQPRSEPRARTSRDVREDELKGLENLVLTTHAGTILAVDDDLFAQAPREIGQLYSAFTSLKKSADPMPLAMRLALAAMVFGIVFGVGFFLTLALIGFGRLRFSDLVAAAILPTLIGGGLALLAIWWTRFRHTCSYVGKKGVAVFYCSGDRDNISRFDLFLFRDAIDLRTAQTRNYVNGVYTGTAYNFTWTDEPGNTIYTLSGNYRSEVGNPAPTDPFHLALMAEVVWTEHLSRELEHFAATGDPIFFSLTGSDYIEITANRFILVQGGTTVKLRPSAIERITIADDTIKIWEPGGKEGWFTNDGVHQFTYSSLGNARFFIIAVNKVLGISFY